MLHAVTLTGADNSTRIKDVLRLCDDFAFAEFGVLVGSRTGPRFPRPGWVADLAHQSRHRACCLSLHICGHPLRELLAGRPMDLVEWFDNESDLLAFGRCQLNFHGEKLSATTAGYIDNAFRRLKLTNGWEPQLIFQLDGVNDDLLAECVGAGIRNLTGLFDKSHGQGVSPDQWPENNWLLPVIGYAGGLGPDNLAAEIPRIQTAANNVPFWIDMETKLMGADGHLSIERCREALAICEPFVPEIEK